MKSTVAEIEAALANYRKVSAERNKRLLEVYIDAIIKAEFTDEVIREETSDEEWAEEQLGAVGYLVCLDPGELRALGVSEPADLLGRYDELAEELGLDGTSGGDLPPGDRAARAAAYFDALEAALREKAPDEVKGIVSAPEELRVLARHVVMINGPMLPHDMTWRAMAFWQDQGLGDHSKIPARITKHDDVKYPWNMDEKVALLWDPGLDSEGEFGCLYAQDSDGTWNWHFGWRWQGGEHIFDNIPELFEWYLWTLEMDLPDLEGLSAEDVMSQAF